MKRIARLLCASLLVAALPSCGDTKPLTQIVVAVDSDWDELARVDIQISGFEQPTTVHAGDLKTHPLPRRVAIVHDGGPLGPIAITVRGYVAGSSDPVLVEPRTHVFFVKDKTLLLKIDLLLKCVGLCGAGRACVAGPKCVSSDAAAKLTTWHGSVDAIKTKYHANVSAPGSDGGSGGSDGSVAQDSGSDSGATGGTGGRGGSGGSGGAGGGASDAGDAASGDAGDSGTIEPPFTPSNVDPTDPAITALSPVAVTLNCSNPSFDSSDLSFSNWCGPKPPAIVVQQDASHDAAVLVMTSLDVGSPATLTLKGDKPIILLVLGPASINGVIDASAHGTSSGPGANRDCTAGLGGTGQDGTMSSGSAGGGGGGFGSTAGSGAPGNATGSRTRAGAIEGSASLVPLRGGCAGGDSGQSPNNSSVGAGGGGGGAVQISSAGRLEITGSVIAVGGGGGSSPDAGCGGGGGGSGGAILLEAKMIAIDSNAVLSANGAGGGAGQPYPLASGSSTPGEDGHAEAAVAAGGTASGIGGVGGTGAWRDAEAGNGAQPMSGMFGMLTVWGGGGGGGGGVGRIRVSGAASCTPAGVFTPEPSVECTSCGACVATPSSCASQTHAGVSYLVCSTATSWSDARDACVARGMFLAHVNDSSENNWLAGQISGESWIGGSDSASEKSWRWVDDNSLFWYGDQNGNEITYAAFLSTEPNDQPAPQDCATIGTDAAWRDRNCDSDTSPYVCEHAP